MGSYGYPDHFLYVSMLWRLVSTLQPESAWQIQRLGTSHNNWRLTSWRFLNEFWTSKEHMNMTHLSFYMFSCYPNGSYLEFNGDTKTRVAESPGVTCSPRCCCSFCCGGRIVGMPDGGRRTASADIQVLEKSRKGQTCLKCLEGTSMRSVFQCGNTMKIYEIRTYLKSSMRGARRFMRHVWLQALATSC